MTTCRWFLKCENEATTTLMPPAVSRYIGAVPVCPRCLAKYIRVANDDHRKTYAELSVVPGSYDAVDYDAEVYEDEGGLPARIADVCRSVEEYPMLQTQLAFYGYYSDEEGISYSSNVALESCISLLSDIGRGYDARRTLWNRYDLCNGAGGIGEDCLSLSNLLCLLR